MERKQAVRMATFTEKASDDLRDNYEGMRENYAEMYKEMPSSISIQAYFKENSIQGESSPPEIDIEAEASESDLNKLAEWMGHFRDWLKWLQLKKHGGGFSGAVLDINDGTPNDYSSFYTHPYAAGPTGSAGLQNIGEISNGY